MFSVTKATEEYIAFHGRKYRLTLYFDRVIEMQKILSDELLDETDGKRLALYLLCEGTERLSTRDCMELLEQILRNYIVSDNGRSGGEQCFDFEQDAEYIYSSFMADYGIDLKKQRGKLLWEDFLALFKGLSEGTKMREVMSIRTRKIPAPTKYNAEERQAIQELKDYYALKVKGKKESNFKAGFAEFAENIKHIAIGGGNNGRK